MVLELFLDKELTTPLERIDFRIVEAGSRKELTVWLYNDSHNEVEGVTVHCDDKNIHFEEVPEKVPPKTAVPLTIIWAPSLDLRKALSSKILILGYELIKPEVV